MMKDARSDCLDNGIGQLVKDELNCIGQSFSTLGQPLFDLLRRKPAQLFDFFGVGLEGPLVNGGVNLAELHAGGLGGGNFEGLMWNLWQLDAELFFYFPKHALIVVLFRIHVARRGTVPKPGLDGFLPGTFLQ